MWRKLQHLPMWVQTVLYVAPRCALFMCVFHLERGGVEQLVLGFGAGVTTGLWVRFSGDYRVGWRTREVMRTGVPSGFPLVDSVALARLDSAQTLKARRSRQVLSLLIVIALPVAAAIVRTPWWLVAVPVLAVMIVWDADAPERARRLREALADAPTPSSTLAPGDGSPPRPAQPAV